MLELSRSEQELLEDLLSTSRESLPSLIVLVEEARQENVAKQFRDKLVNVKLLHSKLYKHLHGRDY